ncbi:MAG: LPP20 family lipoprotein [Bacteroidales bacterium]
MKFTKSLLGFLILGLLITIASCSSLNVSAGNKKKPDWVKSRPVDNNYYIGIGSANTYEDNYTKVAKNNALTDLISEISVKLSSNSVLRQFEDESGFEEEFEAVTKMNMKDDLEGYEVVDSWEGEDKYWVFYRLSKEKYKRQKREKLEKAKSLAKDYYEKAGEAKEDTDIHNALNYYVKAFDAIKMHLDEDLSVFTLDGRIELTNGIYQNIQEIFSSVEFVPKQEEYNLKTLSTVNPSIAATAYYNSSGKRQPIKNLPVKCLIPDPSIDKSELVNSNSSGLIHCTIAEMLPKGEKQKVEVKLNTDTYFGNGKNILNKMFSREGNVPYQYITISVSDVSAFLETTETEFGKLSSGQPVSKVVKKELAENFFSFVESKDKADAIIKIEANTTEGKFVDKYDLYTAYINCNVSITNAQTMREVFSKRIPDIKGMKTGSYQMAAQDALEKAEKEIQQKIIPEIRKLSF